jgi:ABC-2 type transport system permease protein
MTATLTPPAAIERSIAQPNAWVAARSLCARELVRFFRQRNRVFGAIGQPIVFWILFGAGLGPSFRIDAQTGTDVRYAEYFFPGTLMLILLFTAIFTTISVIEDRREGFLQSVLVAPIPRWSMVLGKLLGGTLIALVQGLLFLALGLAAGSLLGFHFTWSPASLVALVAMMFTSALALTGLGFVLAWRMDSTQGFHAVMSVLLMPMWLLSGAFFPASSGLLGWILRFNPLTYGVAGVRRLLYAGDAGSELLPSGLPSLLTCWIVMVLFAAAMFLASCRVARQRTTGDLL